MAKPTNTKASDPSELFLIQMNNLDWNTRLLVPASLLTQFTQLMGLLSVVRSEDSLRQSNAKVFCPEPSQNGEVDYGIARFGTSVMCVDQNESKEYAAFHNSTVELKGITDYSAIPHVSLDEFRKQAKENDHE